jgi:alpha-tubulin suppressor-like RCC1 family protein
VEVRGIRGAARVFASSEHACALLRDGGVRCWGQNARGQTGGAVAYTSEARELVEPDVVPGVSARTLALVGSGTCAITRAGGVSCWGAPPTDDVQSEGPRAAAGFAGVDDLAASDQTVCVLRAGAVSCVGSSYSLFPDFRGKAERPLAIKTSGRVRRVRISESHGCALLFDGRVECWGSNTGNVLGRADANDPSKIYEAAQVEGLPRAVDLFVGASMTCALADTHDVFCWGRWLADGAAREVPTPTAIRIE